MSSELPPELHSFVSLFNQEQYFGAHEVLEELWRRENGPAKNFYQGLIQIAAAFVHVQKKNFTGAERLLKSSRRYLEPYPAGYLSIGIEELFDEINKSPLAETGFPRIYLR